MIELPVDGDPADTRWVLIVSIDVVAEFRLGTASAADRLRLFADGAEVGVISLEVHELG